MSKYNIDKSNKHPTEEWKDPRNSKKKKIPSLHRSCSQTILPLTTNNPSTPINALHPPVPIRRHLLEETRANINIIHLTRLTRIDHGSLVQLLGTRVPDADLGATARVGVGVAAVPHHGNGERDDVFAFVALDAAGAHAGGVVSHVAGVGEDGGEEEE